MVVFFVRVMLFFMSRGADDAEGPQVAPMPAATDVRHRIPPVVPDASADPAPGDEKVVTREEMMKLFGTALRVR